MGTQSLVSTITSQTINRRKTREIKAGSIGIGGSNPVRVQTMTNTPTSNVEATAQQVARCYHAGSELVRITTQSPKHSQLLPDIRRRVIELTGVNVPLVADVHFVPAAAYEALKTADKIRINPGNFLDGKIFKKKEYADADYAEELKRIDAGLKPFIEEARKWKKPLRIGSNHGSLSDRILNRYGDTPEGMVENAMEYMRIFKKYEFENLVIAMKASDPRVMIAANQLLVKKMDEENMDYPLHLGVTEAGNADEGRVKSTLGIGTLLIQGIGDTIRVSLTEPPEKEISVCYAILQSTGVRVTRTEFISCPSCGRTLYDIETITNKIKKRMGHLKGVRIAIMGCVVNGLGEMADADFAYVGGSPGKVNLFFKKQLVKRNVPQNAAVEELVQLIKIHNMWIEPKNI
jgi:(E)-4-hydroxy-3-methylbut-2-enyl-diphosphate synthase